MIRGQFLDGQSSAPQVAQVDIGIDGIVRVQGTGGLRDVPLASVTVSDRLGRTPRRIRFADGAVFETRDNDGVDAALEALGQHGFSRRIDRWERRWQVALGALVAVAVISVLFVRFGVPLLATIAAHTLPASVDRAIGVQGLQLLDKTLLDPSDLAPSRQARLRERFQQMTARLIDGHNYRLELRHSPRIGPNAFALPDGIVVMTDELVVLAHDDDELVAVLAHEIGHVRGRHALRMLLQSAGVGAVALAVLGDISSASALVAAIPTALINAKHSRDFEREADAFAKQWLREQGIPRSRFDNLLCRLAAAHPQSGAQFSYLDSHPPAAERAKCSAETSRPTALAPAAH